MNGLPCIERATKARAGWCEPLGVQCRAFSRELPPEKISRDGRVTPLTVLDVSASEKRTVKAVNAGGTAEGMPFVPIVG